jgi:hypothetical protein
MIDKRIFYCWFGSAEPSDVEKWCIESWYLNCPDYEIVRITESNFDVSITDFCQEAYVNRNYSFVSDVARLEVLKHNSGFYLDTDILLLKSLDELRKYDAIVPLNGKGFYNSCPLGCSTFVPLYEDVYKQLTFGKCANTLFNECCYNRYDLLGRSLDIYDNIAFLGNEYFITPGYKVTDKTIGIHYCLGSWLDSWQGGYDKSKTFNAFEIYQDRVRDLKTENKYYGDNDRIGRLCTFHRPMTKDLIFYGNYFYNKKVVRVNGDGFYFERFSYSSLPSSMIKSVAIEDVVIECQI